MPPVNRNALVKFFTFDDPNVTNLWRGISWHLVHILEVSKGVKLSFLDTVFINVEHARRAQKRIEDRGRAWRCVKHDGRSWKRMGVHGSEKSMESWNCIEAHERFILYLRWLFRSINLSGIPSIWIQHFLTLILSSCDRVLSASSAFSYLTLILTRGRLTTRLFKILNLHSRRPAFPGRALLDGKFRWGKCLSMFAKER